MALRFESQRKVTVIVLAIAAVAFGWLLETTRTYRQAPGYSEKRAAAELAQKSFDTLRDYHRKELGRKIDLDDDPAGTGLIGPQRSAIQNAAGNVAAKRTSINPNFAPVFVDYFQQLGLERGDLVAVGLSGSYPGTNVNLYAAMEAMGLKPIVITAVGSSGYGATDPEFTWLDMERVLAERGVMKIRSIAASPGGSDDMGGSKSAAGKAQIWDAIKRNRVAEIHSASLDESIEKRMGLIYGEARGSAIKAYVNVAGSSASLGFDIGDVPIPSGVHRDLSSWPINWPRQGPMIQLAKRGVPVIHLGILQGIAKDYRLSIAPRTMPQIGEGTALGKRGYSLAMSLILLIAYLLLTFVMILPSWRRLILRQTASAPAAPPAQAG